MDIVRKELTPDELQNPNNRYNPDCDCTQTTIDGGATWQDNPGIDPRTSTALLLPVPTTSDPRCDSATGITANFRDGLTQVIANLNTTSNAFAGASIILTILDFLDGIGLIIQLFIDFCTLILSIGVELVEADFTNSVYAQFACNLYCDCKDDGSFDATAFDKLLTDNATSFGEFSTVNIILNSWLNGLGFVGLSNVGSVKRTSGDCSDCACGWCYEFDFTIDEQGWVLTPIGASVRGQYLSGQGWSSNDNVCEGADWNNAFNVNLLTTYTATVDTMQIDYTSTNGTSDGIDVAVGYPSGFSAETTYGEPGGTLSFSPNCPVLQIYVQMNPSTSSCGGDRPGSVIMSKLRLYGTGDNPFGTNNC